MKLGESYENKIRCIILNLSPKMYWTLAELEEKCNATTIEEKDIVDCVVEKLIDQGYMSYDCYQDANNEYYLT